MYKNLTDAILQKAKEDRLWQKEKRVAKPNAGPGETNYYLPEEVDPPKKNKKIISDRKSKSLNDPNIQKYGEGWEHTDQPMQKEDYGGESDAEHAKQYPKPAKEWEAMKKKYKNFDVVLAKRTQFNEPKSGQQLEVDMDIERDRVRLGAMEDTIAESGPEVLKKYGKRFRDLIRHWTMEWDSLNMLDGGQQKGKPKVNELVWRGRTKLRPGGKDIYDVPRTEAEMKTERPGMLIKEHIKPRFIDDTQPHEKMTFMNPEDKEVDKLRRNKKKRTPSWGKFKGINLDNINSKDK